MRMGINDAVLLGNVGTDPFFVAGENRDLCVLRVVIERPVKSKDGKPLTDIISVNLWGALAQIGRNAQKGDLVFAKGPIQTSSFINRRGAKVFCQVVAAHDFRNFRRGSNVVGEPDEQAAAAAVNDAEVDVGEVFF